MRYGSIKRRDIANGVGVRVSLFVSGCRHHCKNCFNPETWDFSYGEEYTQETEEELLAALAPDFVAGLTLIGGDPFEPENQRELLPLLRRVRAELPQKNIWAYSGYTWEQLTGKTPSPARCEATDELLSHLDVLVDGEFVQAQKNISLPFRGSENQRIIDIPKSLKTGQAVLWTD